jgi:Calcineurin-like phosphoesterase
MLRRSIVLLTAVCALAQAAVSVPGAATAPLQFVFTSDAHYGVTRAAFRGHTKVPARIVNAALVSAINALPAATLPSDGGLRAGEPIGPIDFLASGGDIANREEGAGADAIQSATVSWRQFTSDYLDGLTIVDRAGKHAPLYLVPGNHEASNAVGFHVPMSPPIDKTPMIEIFNRMLAPSPLKNAVTFDYARDRVLYSRDVGGVHLVFLQVWPDSAGRAWMEHDLSRVSDRTPVLVFVHDQPDAEAKHFINPNGAHDINAKDRFENLLADVFADGPTIDTPSVIEQTALEAFLRKHPNVTAYFHGNSNWNEFYDWAGPKRTIGLHVFRVDSPMKGRLSAKDETALSFHVATIDTTTAKMTVRECFWNRAAVLAWGATRTVALR